MRLEEFIEQRRTFLVKECSDHGTPQHLCYGGMVPLPGVQIMWECADWAANMVLGPLGAGSIGRNPDGTCSVCRRHNPDCEWVATVSLGKHIFM